MKRFALAFAFASWLSCASAEMSAITVNASIVDFDESSVTLIVDKKRITVPRELLRKRELKKGKTLQVTFRGEEIAYLLGVKSPDRRSPASAGK